jgi:hypothetical protein
VKVFFPLFAGLFLLPVCAGAQVTVNPAALQQLAGIAAPPPSAVAPQPVVPPVRHFRHYHRMALTRTKPTPPKLPPVAARVAARVVPPPVATAHAANTPPKPPGPAGLVHILFAAGSAALPPSATSALAPWCASTGRIGINAFAPSDPSDPSLALRLSLTRALAVRDALVACGVPTQNILPRALGSVPGQNDNETLLGVIK